MGHDPKYSKLQANYAISQPNHFNINASLITFLFLDLLNLRLKFDL